MILAIYDIKRIFWIPTKFTIFSFNFTFCRALYMQVYYIFANEISSRGR